jgi:choice-of-anchor B domain-containing protein
MKKLLLLYSCITIATAAFAQNPAYRLELAGHWNDTTIAGTPNPFSPEVQFWNDLTGWTDTATGREYVIMGSIDSVYFFDVTDPAAIRKCDVRWGLNRVINRDFETYSHYVYCVSDNGPGGALQIYDLQYLPDSVRLVRTDSALSSNTHSLFIDTASRRMYFNLTKTFGPFPKSAMHILSLEDPGNPTFIGQLTDPNGACGKVHEAYFRNDTAYCSCEYKGLHIFDLSNPVSSVYIGGISPPYPQNGYNHTSWLDSSGKYLVFTDEVPYGLPIKLYDVSNKTAPDYELSFNSNPGATPHNVIWTGNRLWTSAYEDGVVMWDMTNPLNPVIGASYDTYPQNPAGVYNGLTGCWGVYPFFRSGNIAASDMHNGLFLLKYNKSVGIAEQNREQPGARIYPNPFSEVLNITITSHHREPATLGLYDLSGRLHTEKQINLLEGENDIKLEEVSALKSGMYLLRVVSGHGITRQPVVKY